MQTSFFPSPASDPDPEPESSPTPAWFGPPDDEYPARMLVREFLFASAGAVLAVSHVDVYTTGLSIAIDWELRRQGQTRSAWRSLIHDGYAPPDSAEQASRRFGVALADGTVATTVDQRLRDVWKLAPHGPTLIERQQGSSGGDRRYSGSSNLWLWPLPPAGPIELVGEWAARSMPESRMVLDGAGLVAAVSGVRPLWPEG